MLNPTHILIDWESRMIHDGSLLGDLAPNVFLHIFCGNISNGLTRKMKALKDEFGVRCKIHSAEGVGATAVSMLISYHVGAHKEAYQNTDVFLLAASRDFGTLILAAAEQGVIIQRFDKWVDLCNSASSGLELPASTSPLVVNTLTVEPLVDGQVLVKAKKTSKANHVLLVDSGYVLKEGKGIPEEIEKNYEYIQGTTEELIEKLKASRKEDGPFSVISSNFEYNSIINDLRQKNGRSFVRRLNSWSVAIPVLTKL